MKLKFKLGKIFNLVLVLSVLMLPSAQGADLQKVTVFAAASTTNCLTEISDLFKAKNMGQIVTSFGSSSTLAKQIEQDAPAEVFLSASPEWMDFLEKKNLIEPGTRSDLLGNRLVIVAPISSKIKVTIGKNFDLAGILGNEKLAMGDPAHVPAGIYGKKALEYLGVWKAVESKVAGSKDVRAALMLVERGEAPLGIVYATDAAISKKVKVIATFPEDSHPPITYPVALVAGKTTPAGKSFLQFLKTPDAKTIFEKYGFSLK